MTEEIKNSPNRDRPQQLSLLCILSFIGGGASILSNLILYSTFDQIKEFFKDGSTQMILGTEIDMSFIISINPDFFIWQIALFSFSVYGAFLMWNMKMHGFHIYSVSQILLLIIPEIYVPSMPFPLLEISITIVFILLYFKNLKIIGKGEL